LTSKELTHNCKTFFQVIDDAAEETDLLADCQKLLWKLSQKSGVLPSSFFLTDVEKIGEYPVFGGGFADVWLGIEL
jgi:hypothetical protein